jgi:hypothetical protein
MLTLLSTPGDIRNLREEIYTSVRDDRRLISHILRADGIIRSRLQRLYTLDSALENAAPWNGPPIGRISVGDQDGNSGTGSLRDLTPSPTARTQLWTLTFTSTTAFSISGSVSGAQTAGSITSLYTSTDGEISIPVARWTAGFAIGDQIFVSVYKHKPLVVWLSATYATYFASSELFRGTEGVPAEVEQMKTDVLEVLEMLNKPYSEDGMRLDSFAERDISPEGVGYSISLTGQDISQYADNEHTPWSDAQSLTFVNGPVWLI